MTDLADVWLDFDDADECTDLWHLEQGPAAHEDACPLCGQLIVDSDEGVTWPDDVIVPTTERRST